MSRRESLTAAYNKDKNRRDIFTPNFTSALLGTMQKEKRQIMGYEIESKQLWVLSGLLLIFLLSVSGMVAMWFTNTFDNAVFSNLAIIPNSKSYDMFVKPSPKPLLKAFIFNYTNTAEYLSGEAEKLNVEELGPYVYEVALERINIKFNGSKVTYQEQRDYKFMPELSKGRQNDRVMVPNIPLLTAVALHRHSPYFTRLGVAGLLSSLNAEPFLSLAAHRFITGYEDRLYAISKNYMKLQNQHPYERFGLVSSNYGIRDDLITIDTGLSDINKVGSIEQYNGDTSLPHWSTAECNEITTATDGSLYGPKLIRHKRPVKFYLKEMCRALPLNFEKEVKILNGKIPAYRYVMPDSVFDTPDVTPTNQCFCDLDLGACPQQGVFNATPCTFGAPIFISYPHFHHGDPSLKDGVTGLKDGTEYQTYADLHPTLGYVMTGKTRIQVNVQVSVVDRFHMVEKFEDGLMLPVSWIEYALEDKRLPEEMVGIIFQTTFTLRSVEIGLKYGCLLTMAVTMFCIVLVLKNRWKERVRASSVTPLQPREVEV